MVIRNPNPADPRTPERLRVTERLTEGLPPAPRRRLCNLILPSLTVAAVR